MLPDLGGKGPPWNAGVGEGVFPARRPLPDRNRTAQKTQSERGEDRLRSEELLWQWEETTTVGRSTVPQSLPASEGETELCVSQAGVSKPGGPAGGSGTEAAPPDAGQEGFTRCQCILGGP